MDTNNDIFFKLLVKCPVHRLEKLFHHFIDVFCGQQGTLYENYSDIWTLLEWWDLVDSSKDFFKRLQSSENEACNILSSLPTDFENIIKDCLDARHVDVKDTLLEKSHAISPAYLNNFDWKLKLTLGSDKMAQINEPRLFLDLDVVGNGSKSLQLDLSKEELKSLIESMEKAKNAVMDFLISE